ncbi:hypothetical protein [Actinokineospora bangkokensis]|uniref:hypothetical protein n=1 Tax=Actinokineospora bangkokensis TaxID=1193682 RepID=UPI0011782E6F|nr:hypothetical protein [Actinokineospora bangkokensis]
MSTSCQEDRMGTRTTPAPQVSAPQAGNPASSTPKVVVTAPAFAEYAGAGRRGRGEIVVDQHARALDEGHHAHVFYKPLVEAIQVAVSEPDPAAVLAEAAGRAELNGQARAFEEVAAGFLPWWRRLRATPLAVGRSAVDFGTLEVSVAPHLAFRDRHGDEHVVLLHLKEPPLPRDAANAALRLLERCALDLQPGARPLVLDTRRGKELRLSRSVSVAKLDAWLAAEASAYLTHWCRTAA